MSTQIFLQYGMPIVGKKIVSVKVWNYCDTPLDKTTGATPLLPILLLYPTTAKPCILFIERTNNFVIKGY